MSPDEEQLYLLNRRQAIQRVTALLGGVALAGGSRLAGALERAAGERAAGEPAAREPAAREPAANFTVAQIALLDEIADTILPETKTPGAKAAKTGAFMALMVTDAYSPAEQAEFREAMHKIDEATTHANGVTFMEATPAQRLAVLTVLDRERVHYFRKMKELTLLGYFTSEIGCTQAQRYVEAPGRFDPCIAYAPGERAWASHA